MDWTFFDFRYGVLDKYRYFFLSIMLPAIIFLLFMLVSEFLFSRDILQMYSKPIFWVSSVFFMYVILLVDVKRLRDMGWNPWVSLIRLFFILPGFTLSFLPRSMAYKFWAFWEDHVLSSNLIFIPFAVLGMYQIFLLFSKSKIYNKIEV